MIEEAYCSFEVAKLLKEKGFDEECRSYFIDSGDDIRYCACPIKNAQCFSFDLLRPTHQMAMAWLREIHKLNVEVYRTACGYVYCIVKIPSGTDLHFDEENGDDLPSGTWTTHEKAVEAALKYALENLI